MLHSIIEGEPGVGKSHIIEILAEIYLKIGYLDKNIIKKVRIDDLKAKYLGQTAHRTQNAINEALGGILIIDEVYSLGSINSVDIYSQELIDTLNRNLTENAGKFICIIAGYGNDIDQRFFAYIKGLKK